MSDSLLLKRTTFTDKSTTGELYLPDGVFACHTLEDVCRKEKILGQTAIPAGKYEVVVAWSERFQRLMPRLLNVPLYTGVLIHNGNYPEDTEGCILVGRKPGQDVVLESMLAFDDLFPKIKKLTEKGKLFIEIDGGFPSDQWILPSGTL